jgi:hypothetical protein
VRELATFARWEAIILLSGFFFAIIWRLTRMRNPLYQLLSGDRADGTTYLSAGRIQLLIITILFSLRYLALFTRHPDTLPDLAPGYLWALGASQVLYLAGKAAAIFFNRSIFQSNNSEPERRI